MSLIIPNIEMPEYCYDCPIHNGESGRCQLIGVSAIDRPAKCPIFEQKDTAMRTIIRGKGALRLLHCESCGHDGWYGIIPPKFCCNCGAKINKIIDLEG